LTPRLKSSTTASDSPASSASSVDVATTLRGDLLDVEPGGQVGVDEADVHADTCVPCPFSSTRAALVKPQAADFEAEYVARFGMPTQETTDRR